MYLAEKLKFSVKETTIKNLKTFPLVLDITSDVIRLNINGLTVNGYCVTSNRYSVIANG